MESLLFTRDDEKRMEGVRVGMAHCEDGTRCSARPSTSRLTVFEHHVFSPNCRMGRPVAAGMRARADSDMVRSTHASPDESDPIT